MNAYANWTTYTDARNYVSHVAEGYINAVSDRAISSAARVMWGKMGQGEHSEELDSMDVLAIIDEACEKFPS